MEKKHICYDSLKKALEINHNLVIFGPIGSGRLTAVSQFCKECDQPFFVLDSVEKKEDLLCFNKEKGVFELTPFFLAYTMGGILYVDEANKKTITFLKSLIRTSNKKSINIDGQVIKRHEMFDLVVSIDTSNKDIEKIARHELVSSGLINSFDFCYDNELEKSLCDDGDLFDAFLATRKYFEEKQMQNLLTTTLLAKNNKLFKSDAFDEKAIIQSWFLYGRTNDTMKDLYAYCLQQGLKNNKFVVAINEMIETE